MIGYKFVTKDWKSHSDMHWSLGVTNHATGLGHGLCSDGVLHYYSDPELAELFNSIHGEYDFDAILLEIESSDTVASDGLKYGSKSQTPIRTIPRIEISTATRVAFAILCAKEVCKCNNWNAWANDWLSGEDRSAYAARSAAYAAQSAALSAADAAYAALSAADAAYAAQSAAYAALSAAAAARSAADAARSAEHAARSAEYAAQSAAYAAQGAEHAAQSAAYAAQGAGAAWSENLDFKALLQRAKELTTDTPS